MSAQRRQKENYNQKTSPHNHYTAGDLVWLFTPVVNIGMSSKLAKPWKYPFRVLAVVQGLFGSVDYLVAGNYLAPIWFQKPFN